MRTGPQPGQAQPASLREHHRMQTEASRRKTKESGGKRRKATKRVAKTRRISRRSWGRIDRCAACATPLSRAARTGDGGDKEASRNSEILAANSCEQRNNSKKSNRKATEKQQKQQQEWSKRSVRMCSDVLGCIRQLGLGNALLLEWCKFLHLTFTSLTTA